ncbi:MAG: recombinase family protein [Clostridiales bacterium]|nr:recombinase family protein [Clostridiales bacterium]MBE5764407.1 recombinase family protein [Clostridiales bacterium]
MSNVYGYARVSSIDQNLDRQIEQLKEFVLDSRYIVCDKASGKDFDRKGYNLLVGGENNAPLLRSGDLLVITSLDRLGRNYSEIKHQWEYITHTLQVDIKVLDMPLLDTRTNDQSLDKRFIADLVLQILSYTAEKERAFIKKRQRQGIDVAKAKGKVLGRPQATYPQEWEKFYKKWKDGEITAVQCMDILSLKRTTFYKLVKGFESSSK